MSSASRGIRAALCAVLVLAAGLRLVGLSFGLRHPPDPDEAAFVESVRAMIREGDLDHRFYEYPGLFFYLLYPVLRFVPGAAEGPSAYLAARVVVAAFGVLAVALVFLLGRAVAGPRAGLVAAGLLAVSPVAVQTAHMVRPDVALQAFFALALLAFRRLGPRGRDDVAAGAALGLAGAVKFTAVFLVPCYLAFRWAASGPRVKGTFLAGATAVAVFLLASPYSLLHLEEFSKGVETQVSYHYDEPADPEVAGGYLDMAGVYLGVWLKGLGILGTLLSLVGIVTGVRRQARVFLPFLVLPATAVAVLATSHVRHDRFVLAALIVAFLMAGVGAEWTARAHRRLPALLGLAAAAVPLAWSAAYVRDLSRPGTLDRVADWIAAEAPAGARVLTRVPVALPGMEAFRVRFLDERAQVLGADLVVATTRDPPEAVEGLELVHRVLAETRFRGPTVSVYRVPDGLRPRYHTVPVTPAGLTSSSNAGELPLACDGRTDTMWRTAEVQRKGDFLQVVLPGPRRVARVELVLGEGVRFSARDLRLRLRSGGVWQRVRPLDGRPPPEGQTPPASQVLLLRSPVEADALRLELLRSGGRRWGVAELRVEAEGAP